MIHENAFENVVCEMAAILSRPQCVKITRAEIFNDIEEKSMEYASIWIIYEI